MRLKFTGMFRVMTIKNDKNFKKELTCQLRNLTKFDPST